MFGSAPLEDDIAETFDYAWDMTICPVWSGIRNASPVTAVFRASGSTTTPGSYTTESATNDPQNRSSSESIETTVALQDGIVNANGGETITALWQTRRKFRCDAAGLWMDEELRRTTDFGTLTGDVAATALVQGWECSTSALLLIPADLTVGKTWTTTCEGSWLLYESTDPVSCTFEFTADEQRQYSTPGGTWEAIHVAPTANSDQSCMGLGQRVDSYFAEPGGFWLGRGVGILAKADTDSGNYVRISSMR